MTVVFSARAKLTVALIVVLFAALSVTAQVDVSAGLSGSVLDPSGSGVPNASLLALNQQTGVETRVTADGKGSFLFPSLAAGSYTISCEAGGFKQFFVKDVALQSSKVFTMTVTLQVGSANQSVEVSATAAMVNTMEATVQTTYDRNLLEAVPVFGRDPRATMEALMPGATPAGTAASSPMPVTSFNGVAGTSNNYRIDGSDVNDYFHGAPTAYPPNENVQEFSVTSSVPDASVARGAGGQIEAVMKSGTNDLHGQGWAYLQNGGWNANSWQNNWQGISRQPYNRQWYGGNGGGPVLIPGIYNGKNKTFFFSSYERTSTSQTEAMVGQTMSDAERSGNFTNDPSGVPVINGVPTPVLQVSMFSKMGSFLTANKDVLPAPTAGLNTLSWMAHDTSTVQTFVGKIDHNFNDKHRLFGSLWWSRNVPVCDSMALCVFGGASWASHYPNSKVQWSYPQKIQSWTLNDTYTLSSSAVNNFIFGVKRLDISVANTYSPSNALFNASDLGVGAVADVKAPDVQSISFPRSMGMGIYNGYIDNMTQNSFYAVDNLTIMRGRHTFKMGVEIRQYHELKYQTWGGGANIGFGDGRTEFGGTGNGTADMLLGVGASFSQNNTQILNIYYPAREAYFQDSIKLSPRVTLMFGARWEPHFGIHSADGNFVTFRPGQASTEFPTAPVGLVAVGDQGVPSNLYGVRWGNIGPRASFAWDIFGNGRAALRGGYALTTDYQVLIGFNGYTNTAPYGVNYTMPTGSSLKTPYAPTYGSTVPFPYTAPMPGAPGNSSLVFPNPVNTIAMSPDYNAGQIHQFNATFDFEPVKSYLVSVGYVATRGTHLSEANELNWPRFVPGLSTATWDNQNSRRPYFPAGFESINMTNADYNSMYNSLQATFTKRYSAGLTFMGNYTLSSTRQQNGCRYLGDCALDYYSPGTMNRASGAFSYDLPIHFGSNKLATSLLGGWTVGGVVTASSGSYGSVPDSGSDCTAFNFGSTTGCDANFLGGSPYSSNRGKSALDSTGHQYGLSYLNPAKFLPADTNLVNGVPTVSSLVGQRLFLGNAISGVFKGPSAFMLDASLSKTFAITERLKLRYRLEATNALNHTVLGMPGGTVGPDMSTFGLVTSAWSPRMLQMSGHFVF